MKNFALESQIVLGTENIWQRSEQLKFVHAISVIL